MAGGVVLTGGASRRLGRDKATLLVDGETLAARAARVLTAVCAPVVEAGPGVTGLPSVREDPPGAGPLAGVLAVADTLDPGLALVVLACDMPYVDVPLIELLANWPGDRSAVPTVDGAAQYACARWSAAAIERARVAGATSLRALVGADTDFLDESVWGQVASPQAFQDIDTPDDLGSLGL